MNERNDALTAAAEIVLALEDVCRQHSSDEVAGTVGKLTVKPNAANIIPGECAFTVEIRGKTREEIREVIAAWENRIRTVKVRRRAAVNRTIILDQAPVPMDEMIMMTGSEQAALLGYPVCSLGSMAGHDAAHMASITRSGMLFVPSVGGKSHCPEEESRMEDIEKAANVLLHTVLELDRRLGR
jgi:N-carbamoyl-L-amino-acid hydrolase